MTRKETRSQMKVRLLDESIATGIANMHANRPAVYHSPNGGDITVTALDVRLSPFGVVIASVITVDSYGVDVRNDVAQGPEPGCWEWAPEAVDTGGPT